MDLNFGGLGNHIRESIVGLCPIIASVNWKRRAGDDKNGANPFMQFILRTAVSLVIAGILSIGGGMLSAYMVLNEVQIKIDNMNNNMIFQQNLLYQRQDRLEDRLNSIQEKWRSPQ